MEPPRVLYLPPPSHTEKVFRPETYAKFLEQFQVTATGPEFRWTSAMLARRIASYDAVVTGWGSPPFTAEALQRAERLKIVTHLAGLVKALFPRDLVQEVIIPRGLVVFSANGAIALNVAEYVVGAMIMVPRRFAEQTINIRTTEGWSDFDLSSDALYLRGATIGLLSASTVAREVIRLLRPFEVQILVHDPYLDADDARSLGVKPAPMNDLFERSDIISLHAPSISATRHIVGRLQLTRMRDRALLINTARGSIIEHKALLDEAETGRIRVVLDVTDPEPLPANHPLRGLSNVHITPHVSGSGAFGYLKIGDWTLEALQAYFAGRAVPGAIDWSRYDLLA